MRTNGKLLEGSSRSRHPKRYKTDTVCDATIPSLLAPTFASRVIRILLSVQVSHGVSGPGGNTSRPVRPTYRSSAYGAVSLSEISLASGQGLIKSSLKENARHRPGVRWGEGLSWRKHAD